MFNKFIGIGRLTADPSLKYTNSGVGVATFTLAIDRPFQKDGKKETDFINIVVWRQQAENCANYLRKGRLCAVEGSLQIRNYETSEGKRYVTEIVADNIRFLEPSGGKEQKERTAEDTTRDFVKGYRNENQSDPFFDDGKPIDISDDDLPF